MGPVPQPSSQVDGTGDVTAVTAVGPVEGLNGSLLTVTPSVVYNVSVQAYTVGYGTAASTDVISHALSQFGVYPYEQPAFKCHVCVVYFQGPSPPETVLVSAVTFSALEVTWNHPRSPNGELKFYKVSQQYSMCLHHTRDCHFHCVQIYYKVSSPEKSFSISESIFVDQNSYNITNLQPYTNYIIYVTVTNNAEDNPESEPSNIVQTRTLAAPPEKPLHPRLYSGQLIAPDISNSSGPIK